MKDTQKEDTPNYTPNLQSLLILYFRQGKIELRYDTAAYTLLLTMQGLIEPSDFKLALQKSLELSKKHKAQALIFNLELLYAPPPQNYLSPSLMQNILKQGIQKLLIVVSEEVFAASEIQSLDAKHIASHDLIAFFSKEEKAWQYLASFFMLK